MRIGLPLLLASLLLGGCAYAPPPISEAAQLRYPEAGPETEEERAELALNDLDDYCDRNPRACSESELPWFYPNAIYPETQRRFVDDRFKYVRSVGIQMRWDPGTDRFEVLRGNTPIYGGDLRDDP